MSERTKGPWKWHSRVEDLNGHGPLQTGSIYAEPTNGHAYSVAVAPKYQDEDRWKADAAAIVRWENHFDDLVKGLEEIVLRGRRPIINTKDQYVYSAEAEIARAALAKVKS